MAVLSRYAWPTRLRARISQGDDVLFIVRDGDMTAIDVFRAQARLARTVYSHDRDGVVYLETTPIQQPLPPLLLCKIAFISAHWAPILLRNTLGNQLKFSAPLENGDSASGIISMNADGTIEGITMAARDGSKSFLRVLQACVLHEQYSFVTKWQDENSNAIEFTSVEINRSGTAAELRQYKDTASTPPNTTGFEYTV